MKRLSFVVAALLSVSTAPALADTPFSAIYAFGDSLSDAGNVFLATGGLEPASPYSGGRFSNGAVWVQDLSSMLGLPALTPSISGGTDYAFGGATTGNPTTNNPAVPNLEMQVAGFLASHTAAPSTGLYTFSIGANDLFGLLETPGLSLAQMEGAAAQAATVVAASASALEQAGARSLVVLDVPDLGLTPFVRGLGESAAGSALAAAFNADVFADLAPLEATGLTVYDPHAYALLDSAVANPSAYGFTNVTESCWTGGFSGGGGSLCGDPSKYLFWDGVHPTALGQEYIAEAALSAIPEPSIWAMLLLGFGGLGLVDYRRRRAPCAA